MKTVSSTIMNCRRTYDDPQSDSSFSLFSSQDHANSSFQLFHRGVAPSRTPPRLTFFSQRPDLPVVAEHDSRITRLPILAQIINGKEACQQDGITTRNNYQSKQESLYEIIDSVLDVLNNDDCLVAGVNATSSTELCWCTGCMGSSPPPVSVGLKQDQ